MSQDRNCANCVLCLRQDYGYSNYTVEGTSLYCLLSLNPEMSGMESWYGDPTPQVAAILDFADTCSAFQAGPPAILDVDRDNIPYGREPTDAELLFYCDERALPAFRAWLK